MERSDLQLIGLVADVERDLRAFEGHVTDLATALGPAGEAVYRALPAARAAFLAVALHGAYSAVESALERIADTVDGTRPEGPRSHTDLLERMGASFADVRSAVLSPRALSLLRRLLGFRHFFRHAYAVSLDEELLRDHAEALLAGHAEVGADIAEFVASLR